MSVISFEQRLQHSTLYLVGAVGRKVTLTLTGIVALFLVAQAPVSAAPAPSLATVNAHLGGIAVPFEANQGQLAPRVAYAAQTFYGTTFVTRDGELVHALAPPRAAKAERTTGGGETAKAATGPGWNLVERFVGARSLTPRGTLSSPTNVSRFIGNDPARWQRNIPTYARIDLGDPWPGIRVDVAAHGDDVEKIFTIAPGADPGRIEVRVRGALGLRLEPQGALLAQTGNGPVRFAAPEAFQMVGNTRLPVPVRYRLRGHDVYSFSVGAHDASLPLIIDPLLQATYLGSSAVDYTTALVIDNAGNVIVAGATLSSNFPGATGGYQASLSGPVDAFVASLTPDLRTLNQATYLGGSDIDGANALAIDNAGNLLVAGYTTSTDFPGASGGAQATYGGDPQDTFLASLTPDLTTLNQATYLGGSDYDAGYALAIDNAGNVIVAGNTISTNFPGTSGGAQATYGGGPQDTFLASLTPDLTTLNQATYLGGSDYDGANALTIGNAGNLLVAGYTNSLNFPGTTGGYQATLSGFVDAFVASLTPDLKTLNQATYLGGSGTDEATAAAIDNAGNVIVAGYTNSSNFPGTTGGYQATLSGPTDAFVASLGSNLTGLNQATYLGGSNNEVGSTLTIDNAGNVIIAGFTGSTDFPGTTGGYQATFSGAIDAFVASLGSNLTGLNQATYLGGSSTDEAVAAAIDNAGNVIVAGFTVSTDFPGATGGYQATLSGTSDAVIASFTPDLLKVLPVIKIPALSWAGLLALGALLALSGALLARRAAG